MKMMSPCVVNIQEIIAVLEDGNLIEVDGTSGVVKLISATLSRFEGKLY